MRTPIVFSKGSLTAACLTVLATLAPAAANAQRQPFIDQLVAFRALLFAPYGDEGARLVETLDRLSASLDVWDAALRVEELKLREPRATGVRAEDRSALATLLASRGRFGAALFEIEAALVLEPRRRYLHTLRGQLLAALRLETEAAAAYRRAWELDRTDVVSAYLVLATSPLGDPADSAPAPVTALLDAQRRRSLTAANQPGQAPIRDIRLSPDRASRTPVFAPAAYSDGFAAIASGNYGEALTRFRAAVARDPLILDRAPRSTQMSLGIARLRAGLMSEAIAPLEAAVSMFPDSSEARRILGTAYAATGDGDKAVDQLQRAVLLAPGDERCRLALARVLRDTGRLDAAAESLQATLVAIPRSAEARWMLGDVMEKTGRLLDAARELEAAGAAVIAGKGPLYWRVAGIYDRHQEFARVVELLRVRARVDPNDPAVHRQLGLVLHRLGSSDHAFAELAIADLLGGADAEALTAIGQIHLAADRLQDAEAAVRRAIALQADYSEAHYVLGRALLRQGRSAEARDTFEVFQRLRGRAMEDQRRKYQEQVKELSKVSPQ